MIVLGLVLVSGFAYARLPFFSNEKLNSNGVSVLKIVDGTTNCYVSYVVLKNGITSSSSISCVK